MVTEGLIPVTGSFYSLIGVEDDGKLTGARPRHGSQTDPLRLKAAIFNNTIPNLHVDVTVVSIGEVQIIVIKVPKSNRPIGTTSGLYVRRAILGTGQPGCIPFYAHEMDSHRGSLCLFDITAQPITSASWKDLEPLEFHRLRRLIEQYHGDSFLLELNDFDMAKALGLVEGDSKPKHPTLAGLLILGTDAAIRRNIPAHEVAFQVLQGTEVKVNIFYRGPLIGIIEEVMTQFRSRNIEEEVMVGPFRLGVPNFSEQSIRESLLNAVIHRDYQQLGAVHFQWYENRIEISNPGGFVEGVNISNLLVAPPRSRNSRLADVFSRIGLVERTGRGIDIIFEGQVKYGRHFPDYSRTTDNNVVVLLQGGPANLNFCKWLVEQEKAGQAFSLNDLIVLSELQRKQRIDLSRAIEITQETEQDALNVFENLTHQGILRSATEKTGTIYTLSSHVGSVWQSKPGDIALGGDESAKQEEMILQYVRKHNRIKRGQAAELCSITVFQANRLLTRLWNQRKLLRKGQGKGTYYILP